MELDVRLTQDTRVVCFHDERLDRVTPQQGRVADWTWDSLSEVPVLPTAFGGAYPEARVPLLAEVFRALPEDCFFLVELKADLERPEALVRATLEVIQQAGAGARCRIISFEQDLLLRARAALQEVPQPERPTLGVLVGARNPEALLQRAREVEAEALHPQHSWIDAELVAAAREGGFLVNAWTVNSAEDVRRLRALGVDEITTDYPEMALNAR